MWLLKLRRESDVGVHTQQKHTTWTEQPTHKYYVFPGPKGTKYRHGHGQHHSVISITGGMNRFGNNTQSPHTQAASPNQQISFRHQTNVLRMTPNQWLASDTRQMSYAWLKWTEMFSSIVDSPLTISQIFPPSSSWSSRTNKNNTHSSYNKLSIFTICPISKCST